MSVAALTWAWGLKDLSGIDLLVMLALADSADAEHHRSWLSVSTLVDRSRSSKSTVLRALTRLENLGLVSKTPRYVPDSRTGKYRRTSNEFELNVGFTPSLPPETPTESKASVSPSHLNSVILTPLTDKAKHDSTDMEASCEPDTEGDGCHPDDTTPRVTQMTRQEHPYRTSTIPYQSSTDARERKPVRDRPEPPPNDDPLSIPDSKLVKECLPDGWADRLDRSSTIHVSRALVPLLDAGWEPFGIRLILEATPLPDSVRNWSGIITHRISDIPRDPPDHRRPETPPVWMEDPEPEPQPPWVLAWRDAVGRGESPPKPFLPEFGTWLQHRHPDIHHRWEQHQNQTDTHQASPLMTGQKSLRERRP